MSNFFFNIQQLSYPTGCFTDFLQFFGASIFVLWKLALLKKRIILFSPPPVGVLCHRGNYWGCGLFVCMYDMYMCVYTYLIFGQLFVGSKFVIYFSSKMTNPHVLTCI